MTTTIVQTRGAKGLTAAEQLMLAGLIEEPTVAAMDERYSAPGEGAVADVVAAIAASDAKIAETEETRVLTDAARVGAEAVIDSGNAIVAGAPVILAARDQAVAAASMFEDVRVQAGNLTEQVETLNPIVADSRDKVIDLYRLSAAEAGAREGISQAVDTLSGGVSALSQQTDNLTAQVGTLNPIVADSRDKVVDLYRLSAAEAGAREGISQAVDSLYGGVSILNQQASDLTINVGELNTQVAAANVAIARLNRDVPAKLPPSHTIGTMIFGGIMSYVQDNTTPKTYRTIFALPAGVKRVRPIYSTGHNAPVHIGKAAVAAISSAANFAASGVTWKPALFDGQASGIIPARPGAFRRDYLANDWVDVASVQRTDDLNALPLIVVSAYVPDAANITMLGTSAGPFYLDWANDPTRPHVMRYSNGDCVTNPAAFTSTTNRSTSPIIGIQYELVSGEVLTIAAAGNSITEGANATVFGNSWFTRIARQMQSDFMAVDRVMLAWSGNDMPGIRNEVLDYYAFCERARLVPPTILFAPNASPNSLPATSAAPAALTKAMFDSQYFDAVVMVRAAKAAGTKPIIWTILPTNANTKIYSNGTDSVRRDYNKAWRDMGPAGVLVADMDAIMSGPQDANGQATLLYASQAPGGDGIHPNDQGNDVMSVLGVSAVRQIMPSIGLVAGALVA
ncbi:SGNH/GDSL hydrolase family protein [Sphingomonas sp. R86521]|uniref:SGNH/GDSL hydrolase family protein n=1 Tax=Sphingomonas sp. R86521 TaxID=3093860 RepID=UPI0036D4396F